MSKPSARVADQTHQTLEFYSPDYSSKLEPPFYFNLSDRIYLINNETAGIANLPLPQTKL